MKYRAPLNTALVGLLISPAAMAQTTPQVPATPPAQTTTDAKPPEPGAAGAPASTLPQVTVKGSRPSEDFNDQRNSFSKLPAELRDIPQSVTIINKALMQSQGATSLASALRNVARPHHRRGRRRHDRQQHQPQRLLGTHRHLPRRHARPRPVLPRHLRARADRGADGSVVDAVRPRLDRRRDQPGAEEAVAQKASEVTVSATTNGLCAPRPTSTSRSTKPLGRA